MGRGPAAWPQRADVGLFGALGVARGARGARLIARVSRRLVEGRSRARWSRFLARGLQKRGSEGGWIDGGDVVSLVLWVGRGGDCSELIKARSPSCSLPLCLLAFKRRRPFPPGSPPKSREIGPRTSHCAGPARAPARAGRARRGSTVPPRRRRRRRPSTEDERLVAARRFIQYTNPQHVVVVCKCTHHASS